VPDSKTMKLSASSTFLIVGDAKRWNFVRRTTRGSFFLSSQWRHPESLLWQNSQGADISSPNCFRAERRRIRLSRVSKYHYIVHDTPA
jgi:hypothetical protein